MAVKILTGDCRDVLKTLPDESVHCVVTSPPYWGLRDYGTAQWEGGDPGCDHSTARSRGDDIRPGDKQGTSAGSRPNTQRECKCGARRIDSQLGLEPSFTDYIETMVGVFREVRRVLRKDGTCWVNMGDSYATSISGQKTGEDGRVRAGVGVNSHTTYDNRTFTQKALSTVVGGLKPKDLCGIPWRLAFALQADGWWLRSDIIWSKPNPMPESVTDRPTKAHEYIFLLSKAERYYYDAEAIREAEISPGRSEREIERQKALRHNKGRKPELVNDMISWGGEGNTYQGGRNRRTVWEIATAPFSEAHFATFPPALVEPCIKAGTSEKGCCKKCGAPWARETDVSYTNAGNGNNNMARKGAEFAGTGAARPYEVRKLKDTKTIGWSPSCSCNADVVPCQVLDCFGGAGTTGLVADRLGRNAILIELNPQYAEMARKRLENDAGLFYNADKDFGGSIDECYKAIRERRANGGPGWTDEKQQELL